ncbi:hypothetical protein [Aestuariivita sp.]|jgi:hypothetical protein|uniref:hypothetical protein n=1 Tax=Aestuariivita sp. TaxID=1872407 RepID=UPI00216ED2C0|nr:hypothetical protein [Aestuariivita sp.]MCE8009437.1 hypothetical protein [Aestuariivita sp.]
MTALKKYQRLEASGLWRPTPEDQRREVVVSIGDATLVITDTRDRALTHWSLAAIDRQNPGAYPAIYSPDGDTGETLELAASEDQMIRAIEKLRGAIARARPHPGRLRLVSVILSCLAVVALGLLWLPGAMTRHTLSVVPEITRTEIGQDLLARITRVSGPACQEAAADPVLARLAERTGVREVVVLPAGVRDSLALPGGLVLLNRAVIEDHEDPDVAAGFILAERVRAAAQDPLADLLRQGGFLASFRLITTGALAPATLDAFAETVLVADRADGPSEPLLAAFAKARIRSTPYAYALDITGETTLPLIEADPMNGQTPQSALPDRDWLVLQAICEG